MENKMAGLRYFWLQLYTSVPFAVYSGVPGLLTLLLIVAYCYLSESLERVIRLSTSV